MDKKIIAFGHQKGVGKDTAAKFLDTFLRVNYPKLKIKNIGFADKLKDISYQLFKWGELKRGIFYETHYEEKEIVLPRLEKSPRDIWKLVGNKMREIDLYVWIDNVLKNVDADIIIISDLRFINEATEIKAAGGMLVKITRPNVTQGTDPAEIDLKDWTYWDYFIDNRGTLQDLNKDIEQMAKNRII